MSMYLILYMEESCKDFINANHNYINYLDDRNVYYESIVCTSSYPHEIMGCAEEKQTIEYVRQYLEKMEHCLFLVQIQSDLEKEIYHFTDLDCGHYNKSPEQWISEDIQYVKVMLKKMEYLIDLGKKVWVEEE